MNFAKFLRTPFLTEHFRWCFYFFFFFLIFRTSPAPLSVSCGCVSVMLVEKILQNVTLLLEFFFNLWMSHFSSGIFFSFLFPKTNYFKRTNLNKFSFSNRKSFSFHVLKYLLWYELSCFYQSKWLLTIQIHFFFVYKQPTFRNNIFTHFSGLRALAVRSGPEVKKYKFRV